MDDSGPWYRVVYRIDDWGDADEFTNALMGFATSTGPISGATVTRGVPHQHPLSENLFCKSATVVEGLGQPVLNSDGYPDYDGGALIQAEYRPMPWDFSGGNLGNQIDPSSPLNWCTQEIDFSTETYTMRDSLLTYTAGPLAGNPVRGVHLKFQIPITTLTLTWHKLPYLPMTTVRALRGRVNNATFLGSPQETVLFKGAKTSREWNTDGSVVQRVVIIFEERDAAHPWNSLPTDSDPTFYPVVGTGGAKMYRTADLSPLIQF